MGIYVGENPLSVPGMSAYQEAIKGGFAGTREDFDKALKDLPDHLADEVRHITARCSMRPYLQLQYKQL